MAVMQAIWKEAVAKAAAFDVEGGGDGKEKYIDEKRN